MAKNISKKIYNGRLVITRDDFLFGSDGKSKKTRMTAVVDSNSKDELALVKYTTSKKHGRKFSNNKGFNRHGDNIYTLDNSSKPIKIDNVKFRLGSKNRSITKKQANEIKRRNLKENKNRIKSSRSLRKLKGR